MTGQRQVAAFLKERGADPKGVSWAGLDGEAVVAFLREAARKAKAAAAQAEREVAANAAAAAAAGQAKGAGESATEGFHVS